MSREVPQVSIVMPTYNRSRVISRAIRSVLAQTEERFELIVIDDGSTDSTADRVKSFCDKRIKYIKQVNMGPAHARNLGVSVSQCKWIAYLDDDNEFYPEYIEKMLKAVRQRGAVMALPRAHRTLELYQQGVLIKEIEENSNTPSQVTINDIFMKKIHVDTNGFMHLRRVFDEDVRWDSDVHGIEDWDLVMSIGRKYPEGFVYVSEVLCRHHRRYGIPGIVSDSKYSDWAEAYEYVFFKHKDSKMLEGQEWYPSEVQKWRTLQDAYDKGRMPPYYLYNFEKDTSNSVYS